MFYGDKIKLVTYSQTYCWRLAETGHRFQAPSCCLLMVDIERRPTMDCPPIPPVLPRFSVEVLKECPLSASITQGKVHCPWALSHETTVPEG